ncbi:hypothetical protein M8C13_38565 [Crossiella sp. SN42]|uniref:hypothetical protein n=1 Tax=Crossiella sp. SN42 TaxID=2944808 RepID=UPI00207CDE6C|nr:hypothetical protein [Crossiella sp. SN42]MCO1581669.1 hypothetical protein [Crossiella sp. SN42]
MSSLRHSSAFRPVSVVSQALERGPVIAAGLRTGGGLAPCPAAPLLAGSLRRLGLTAGQGLLTYDDECGDHRCLGFTASWVDDRGRPAGLGAAADADHPATLAATAAVVREWSAALRPRRILLLDRPRPVDLLLVLDPAALAPYRDVPAHLVRAAGQVRADWLAEAGTVGLLLHRDTRRRLLTGVIAAIGGLGPTRVESLTANEQGRP